MVDLNEFHEEKSCVYKDEEYLVRDNGAVLRKSRPNQKARKLDNEWTFGKINQKNGYLEIASERVHRIVAVAFIGDPPTKEHIVDHIDTNRQNNRPSNLRWITKLENVVLNEFTRKKIEYIIGDDIYKFLENPALYRNLFTDPNFAWMRTVSKEEAQICLENMKKWSKDREGQSLKKDSKLGEWIYQKRNKIDKQLNNRDEIVRKISRLNVNVFDSLTPLAKQKDWQTPTKFCCCPNLVKGEPISCYLNNLSENISFSENIYGKTIVLKYNIIDEKEIAIITDNFSSMKRYGVVKVTYENNYYLHTSLGTFFTYEGALKKMTIEQGLEWTGPDNIDDYC